MLKDYTRKVVIVNQATNYLTIGFCNAFLQKNVDVTLITGSIHEQEEKLNSAVKIKYINSWASQSSGQKLNSYLLACWKIFWLIKLKFRMHEVIFISLPPMGYLLNLILSNRFSMIIWDVYPDAMKITGMSEKHILYKTWTFLNKKSFSKAYKIYTIGNKLLNLLDKYMDREKIILHPIWSNFQQNIKIAKDQNPFVKLHNLQNKFIVQYSGNIGLTHNIEVVLSIAESLQDEPNILFQIISRGPRLKSIMKVADEKKLHNCHFLPFQDDDMFINSLSAADLGVVILDELASKGSVPSKSYNLMSLGIPSLYISSKDSELNDYAIEYNNAKCFTPLELDLAKNFILKLANDQEYWQQLSENSLKASLNFKRRNADLFIEDYLS